MLERNILSFLNHKLHLITPTEVATSYMQLVYYKQDAAIASNQSHCRDDTSINSLSSDQSLPILITFYCLSSK